MKVRKWLLAAAAGAALTPLGASAATIVATDSEFALRGFSGFDATLGTLNSATLTVDILKYRAWLVRPTAGQLPNGIGWSVSGLWQSASNNSALPAFTVALSGSGNSPVSAQSDGANPFGFFDVTVRGTGSVTLDAAALSGRTTVFNGYDTGFTGTGGDTSFPSAAAGLSFTKLQGACFIGASGQPTPSGEDFCGSVRYTLTYDYTPFGAAVPEPATWAMMVFGFGLAGAAIRRRRAAGGPATA